MALTALQLEQRRHGIGGSDVGAIVGFSPYARPIDVWLEKTGRAEPRATTQEMEWGNIVEPALRDYYALRHGVCVVQPGQLVHPERPWMTATPDGLVQPGRYGLEIKTTDAFMAAEWGEPGSDEVPLTYLAQCAWYMAVTGCTRWDVTVAIGRRVQDYTLHRDDDLIEQLVAVCERFWVDHVLADHPPQADGSESFRRFLDRKYPEHSQCLRQATEDEEAFIAQLREARLRRVEAEREEELWKQLIMERIGGDAGLESSLGRVTWRRAKDSARTDWKSVCTELQAPAELLAEHTRVVPGSRRFIVPKNWGKDRTEE